MELFDVSSFYEEFCYPSQIIKAAELGLVDFDYWYFMSQSDVASRMPALMERYPNRKLVPFARRDDCDDIACFEIGKEDCVQIIHDFASAGWEQRGEYLDFWAWMKSAIDELAERSAEEESCDCENS